MKIKEWVKMLQEYDQEKELCIARPIAEVNTIKIKYEYPSIVPYIDIDKSWRLYETNKVVGKDGDTCDYVIY